MEKPGKGYLNHMIKFNITRDAMWVSGTPDTMRWPVHLSFSGKTHQPSLIIRKHQTTLN